MSNQRSENISFSFSVADGLSTNYWIKLEQVQFETDTVSISEASSLIDKAFELEPCETDSDTTTIEQSEPVEESAFDVAVYESFNIASCFIQIDGSYETDIKVYRSHQTFPYKLIINGGEKISTSQLTEEISVDVDLSGKDTATLDKPIIKLLDSTALVVGVDGSTIQFQTPVQDVVSLRYETVCDVVTIKVSGNPATNEPNECICLGFYQDTVNELTLKQPEVDESESSLDMDIYCNVNVEKTPQVDEVTCYEIHHRVTKCKCSETEVDRVTVEVDVDCPVEYNCPGAETKCRNLIGSKTIHVASVHCDGEETQVNDPDFYEDICCTRKSELELPQCENMTLVYRGGEPIDGGTDKYKGLYGNDLKIVPVGPKTGICGNHYIEYKIQHKNCCDEIVPTVVDYDSTDDIIADNSDAVLAVKSDLSEIFWDLSAAPGLYLDPSRTKKTGYAGKIIRVYSDEVCGALNIKADDGCEPVYIILRATTGEWVQRGYWDYGDDNPENNDNIHYITGETTLRTLSGSVSSYDVINRYAERVKETIDCGTMITTEGSPWDAAGYEGECNQGIAYDEQYTRCVPYSAEPLEFTDDSWHKPGGCCDSVRCWPDSCVTTCGGGGGTNICYPCTYDWRYIIYYYWGGPWRLDCCSLFRQWYYTWEC